MTGKEAPAPGLAVSTAHTQKRLCVDFPVALTLLICRKTAEIRHVMTDASHAITRMPRSGENIASGLFSVPTVNHFLTIRADY